MKNVMCKGSWALGSACGTCSRCKDEVKMLFRIVDVAEKALEEIDGSRAATMFPETSWARATRALKDVKAIRGK